MRRSQRRLWLAGFLVLTFLTVQLAAAAYACAGGRFAMQPAMGADVIEGMSDMAESCPDMAKKAPQYGGQHDGLCLEHCQAGTKTADHVSPQVPAFLPVLIGQIEPTPIGAAVPLVLAQGDAIARAPPPPIAILHCCFRN
ncbi:copper resistance protein [Ralstonia pseudosolanacearum]|uniref:copper resistance protein n=1 Tax=Ralstonia pseudosolanacearum TaxID=1310165 RepID=UPI001FFA220F|nr:copper resistance protein [Ralstonia pseudosolanacearum]